MKAMEPGAPMISVPAGVLKEFMTSTPSPTPASLVNNKNETPMDSPKAPSQTRTPSPDLPNRGDDSALPTDNNKKNQMNGDTQNGNDLSDVEKTSQNNIGNVNVMGTNINLPSSITVTSENVSQSVNSEPEKRQLNGTVGSSLGLKRPSEEAEGSKYPDLKKIRVFAEEKSKSSVQQFNKLLDQESKKFEDPDQDEIMCLSSSVTVTKSEDRTVNDSLNSEGGKTVPSVSEPVHANTSSPLPKFENNVSKLENNVSKIENVSKCENNSKFENKSIDKPKNDVKSSVTKEKKESFSHFASDLEVLTPGPSRENDALKPEPKFSGKLKKLPRKELERVVMRLFSEKTLYQCELGRQKQLCEKLETTLEANRKKTAQFHKEIEDLRKVTNRLAAEQASRKGQYVAPIRIKRSVGIQAAPHIINKGLQHAQGQNSSIKTISPRSSLSPMKSIAGPGGQARLQNASPNVTFHNTKMIPSNNPNMLPGGVVGGMLSTSQPGGGRPQALSSVLQGSPALVSTAGTVGTITHPAGSIGTVRPATGQMMLMAQPTPGMMQAIQRPTGGGVVFTANKTVVPVVQGRVVRSSVVPISNIISSGNVISNQRHLIVQNRDVTATTNAVNTPLISRGGGGVVDLTADEGRTTIGRTTNVMPAPGTLVKVPVSGATQLVAGFTQSGGVVLLPNASAGAALVVSQVSGVQTVNNVTNPVVAQARTGTVTSTPRVMGTSFKPISSTTTTGSSSVVAQHRHPAPLPRTPVQQVAGITKKLPPQPTLKLSHKDNSIVLSWTMGKTEDHEAIASYQLYAYQEGTLPPSAALWKKVGSVKALELPMACTLTQFMPGHVYHFAVRAVDIKSRLGPFSDPRSIRLEKK